MEANLRVQTIRATKILFGRNFCVAIFDQPGPDAVIVVVACLAFITGGRCSRQFSTSDSHSERFAPGNAVSIAPTRFRGTSNATSCAFPTDRALTASFGLILNLI